MVRTSPQHWRLHLASTRRLHCRGFTYLIALFAVATASAMVAAGSIVWQKEAQRAREQELLRVGNAFSNAIGRYYERTPGTVKRFPPTLEDLLRDDRYLSLQRYLRRIYRDPLTGKTQWGLVDAPGGGIMGVYSLSEAKPVKVANFDDANRSFTGAQRYADWKFVYVPVTPAAVPPQSKPGIPNGGSPPQTPLLPRTKDVIGLPPGR
jgi:type II secretory pathway pseudopilin PulG